MNEPIRLLILKSRTEKAKLYSEQLSKYKEIEIVLHTNDKYEAYDILKAGKADVLILDVEMPKMEGNIFLRDTITYTPLPVIVLDSATQKGKLNIIRALSNGASDYFFKPVDNILDDVAISQLYKKIKNAIQLNIENLRKSILEPVFFKNFLSSIPSHIELLIVGFSNSELPLFLNFVKSLNKDFPCIVAVSELKQGYTKTLADVLREDYPFEVKEATEGDEILKNRLIIASGNFHIKIEEFGDKIGLTNVLSEKLNGKRPSLDLMMYSAAEHIGYKTAGLVIGGNTQDGVLGLKSLQLSKGISYVLSVDNSISSGAITSAINFGSVEHIIKI